MTATVVPLDLRDPIARVAAEQTIVPRVADAQVLLTPSNVGILARRRPQIVVVQNAAASKSVRAAWREKIEMSSLQARYHDTVMPISHRRAAAVVAVSRFMAEALIEDQPAIRDHLHVIPEGVALERFSGHRQRQPEEPFRILFLSTLFPYKGAGTVIEAVPELRRILPTDTRVHIRFVGRDPQGGAVTTALLLRARELGCADVVEFAGPVPHANVPEEYQRADVFLYPSLLESFGLPPLEAMASGVPVLVSDQPAVQETVGDAAITVDPWDPVGFARAIARTLTDRRLRQRLIRAGQERAAKMTWNSTAEQMVQLCQAIAHK